jgi:hypothetical protein
MSITFESGSQLSELAKEAFCESGLISIHLPASATVIGEGCFSGCVSLASITFDPASQLQEIHRNAFYGVPHLNPVHNYLTLQLGHFVAVA